VTQGLAPLHPGLSPCAALRRGRARDACRRGCVPKYTTADFRCQTPAVTTLNQDVTQTLPPDVGNYPPDPAMISPLERLLTSQPMQRNHAAFDTPKILGCHWAV
jgi:hypothetical protein